MPDFREFLENNLNQTQREAVEHSSGPVVVIAGAGSGKTRVITARIVHLLEQQVHPAQIIALTFTNKAAAEMKERITHFLPGGVGVPFVGTFHAYCLSLLKTNSYLLPYGQFSILDEDDKRALLTKLLKRSPLYKQYSAQQLAYRISLLKNQQSSIGGIPTDNNPDNRLFGELLTEYEREKRASNCLDFDDLLLEAIKLFDNEQFQKDHQYQVRHILVDEYQDTNHVQHELLKKMALKKGSLVVDSVCVVGDQDQSIYSWRGATVDNIVHFQKDFKNTTHLKIEQNYRSKQPILTAANQVIGHNVNRHEKKLWSERKGTDCIRILQCLSSYQEADIIARLCKVLKGQNLLTSVAVLYRTHFQSRSLEEALIKLSIPYQLIGGVRFYERKEIKDVLAYVRLIVNPFDRIAFERAIGCPARGLGEKFVEQFMELWDTQPFMNFKEVAQAIKDKELLPPGKAETLDRFVGLFSNLTPASSALEVVSNMLTKLEYFGHIKKSYEKEEAQSRQENVKELIAAIHFFASQGKHTIEQVLDEVSLLQEKATSQESAHEGVSLMTLHAAKGLEFDIVIIPGLEENLFPSSRSCNEQAQLEEERRLFYVGITRARNKLLLTSARYRQMYGQMEEAVPSRFLKELPSRLCKTDMVGSWQQYEITTYFSQWFGFATASPDVMTFAQFIPSKPAPTVTPACKEKQASPGFKKHQTVKHKNFGIGVIQSIEQTESRTIVTAQFKGGLKKIDARFVQEL